MGNPSAFRPIGVTSAGKPVALCGPRNGLWMFLYDTSRPFICAVSVAIGGATQGMAGWMSASAPSKNAATSRCINTRSRMART